MGTLVLPAYLQPDEPDPESAPLDLVICQACELVQLRYSVENDRLYRQYWYQSGINETMVAELRDIVTSALALVHSSRYQGHFLDIGANDGTLLRLVGEHCGSERPLRIAVEPATTFADRLRQHADVVFHDYFPNSATKRIDDLTVMCLTSIAMFYDLDDPLRVVEEVDRLLTPDGIWIVQMQDLAQMIAATAYDNICFEHRAYYSTATFNQLLTGFDLEIRAVETRAINGGSLRYYITRRDSPIRIARGQSLQHQLTSEAWLIRDRLQQFATDAAQHKAQLVGLLASYRSAGVDVDLYAASTKSSTLLQYCGIDHGLLRCAVERSPEKVGLVTSGTRIPIISEAEWRKDPAPVALLSAWGFRDAVIKREDAYLEAGGTLIVPLPAIELFGPEDCQMGREARINAQTKAERPKTSTPRRTTFLRQREQFYRNMSAMKKRLTELVKEAEPQ